MAALMSKTKKDTAAVRLYDVHAIYNPLQQTKRIRVFFFTYTPLSFEESSLSSAESTSQESFTFKKKKWKKVETTYYNILFHLFISSSIIIINTINVQCHDANFFSFCSFVPE